MSTPMNHDNDNRFDSALSLPLLPNSWSSPGNAISAGLGVPHSAPWSQINTRLGHDQAPVYWDSERRAPAFDCDNPTSHALPNHLPQGLEESLASIESKLCLPIHDAVTPTGCSSPSSPPLPLPWAAASSATGLLAVPPSSYTNSTTICCGHCAVQFTGTYRRGNLARHVRQKHTEAKRGPYTCTATGCYRVFARQDARLKHARKHHPGLHLEPTQKRQGHEKDSMSSQSAKDGAALTYRPRSDPIPIQNRQNYESNFAVSPPGGLSSALTTSLKPDEAQCPELSSQHMTGFQRSSTTDTLGTSTVASSLDFNVGQWLPTSPQSSMYVGSVIDQARKRLQGEVQATIEVEELSRAARILFASLHAKLDSDTYSRFCDSTFRRWEGFVQQLRDEWSDTYFVYAKVLEDLYAVVHAIDSGAVDPASLDRTRSDIYSCQPSQGQQAESHGPGALILGLDASVRSSSSRDSKHSRRKASEPNSSRYIAKVSKSNKHQKPESRAVDCPEHKHYIMHRPAHPPPCRGCRETFMAQVRSHLNRVGHRDFTTAKPCPVCKMDFTDQRAYNDHEAAMTCHHQAQSRRDIIIPWARLYLTRYPGATRVPSPYCDENGWLPDSVLAQCRSSLLNSATPSLGRQGPAPMQPPTNLVDESSYNGALDFMLQDLVAPTAARSGHVHAAVLAGRVSRLSTVHPQPPSQGLASHEVQRYRSQLHGVSAQYFRLLADAPRYLTEEGLRDLANEAQAVVHNIRNYQRRQSQQNQDHISSYPIPFIAQPSTQDVDASHTMSMRDQRSPAISNDHYPVASMSTGPSSQSFNAASSNCHISTQTGPSSVYDPANQTLLSPFSTPNYRRTSLSSQATPGELDRHRALSTSQSHHDAFIQGANQANATFFDD